MGAGFKLCGRFVSSLPTTELLSKSKEIMSMRYKYYKHCKLSFTREYFGDIGPPVRISAVEYYVRRLTGYRVTKVHDCLHDTMYHVAAQALLNSGTSLRSYRAEKTFEAAKEWTG